MKGPFIFLCPEVTREDARTLAGWLRDEEVRRYLSDMQNTSSDIEQLLERVSLPVLTHFFTGGGRFYMALDAGKKPVGFVRLQGAGGDYEIVVVIGDRKNWGRRLGTGTIRESLRTAFCVLRAERVTAKIHRGNLRSARAFAAAGFTPLRETPELRIFTMTLREYLDLMKGRKNMPEEITITEIDRERLEKLILASQRGGGTPDTTVLKLESELKRARIVNSRRVPREVVTMNSRALLDLDDEELEVSLVYPADADWNTRKMSVCSPIGAAILGYSEGAAVEWDVPSGKARVVIKKVLYQPEAAGDFHL